MAESRSGGGTTTSLCSGQSKKKEASDQAGEGALIVPPVQSLVPCGSSYTLEIIQMAILFVLQAATSLRSCEACINLVYEMQQGKLLQAPTHTTIQNWILRLGLYELTRPKQRANDWIWIVDHTIQIGDIKCLLAVGIRASHWQELKRPIEHRDLQVLELKPVGKSTGVVVQQQFASIADRCGIPLAVLSDQGSDIKKGVRLLRELQAQQPDSRVIIDLSDIAHKVASVLKRILEQDERWSQFTSQCGKTKAAIQQTKLAHLTPPKPKSKARYMNIAEQVRWGTRMGNLLYSHRQGTVSAIQQEQLPAQLLEQKLGWIDEYKQELSRWQELSDMGQALCREIRTEGYHADSAKLLSGKLPVVHSDHARQLREEVIAFIASQCEKVPAGERLPGSSEVIESLIGKGKRLEGQQSQSGFTRQILAMASSVVTVTEEVLQSALKQIGIKHLNAWCSENLPQSVQSKRQRDLCPIKKEQKPDNIKTTPTPIF